MKSYSTILAVAGMAATVSGHGFITSPQARMPGSTMEAACGQQVYYNQMGDNYGNIQGMLQVAASQTDYNAAACKIWMCKGYKYADNTANVQKYTAGQVVPMTFDIRAPHTGVANVSIVRTSDNTAIGSPLISWTNFASNAVTIPEAQKSFSITIPSDLGTQCSTAGACIIHHFWNAADINQTYESCVDFTVGGSGAAAPAKSPVSVTSAVAVSSPVATTAPTTTPATTAAPVASTCACNAGIQRRDQTICETIVTSTVSSTVVETITNTVSASNAAATGAYGAAPGNSSQTISYVTVTETETSTIMSTTTVAPSSTAAAASAYTTSSSVVVVVSATSVANMTGAANASTPCTTKITVSRASTVAPYPAGNSTVAGVTATGTGTGLIYPTAYPIAYTTSSLGSVEANASSSLASLYSSLTSVLSAYPTGSLVTGTNPLAPIANLTSALPSALVTSAIPSGVPSAIPSSYGGATPGSSTPNPSGLSLQDLLKWVAYLLGEFEGERENETAAAGAAPTKRSARVIKNFRA